MHEPTTGETAAMVALLRRGRRPWTVYAELVEERGSAREVLSQKSQRSLFDDERSLEREIATAAADVRRWSKEGMQVLTVLDAGYPENLRTVHDRPPLVFVGGRLTVADSRSIAVVGARQATTDGRRRASEIAEHLVEHGYTVASGLAAGIDTAAHTAALAKGGRTIAVIGTGLRRCYPPENAALQRTIAEHHAVISQFWPDAPPTRRTFPMRNATMSGLTLATVVVEASHTSGSRMQARLALEHGRPVFLHEALIGQEWAQELAQRPGTRVISSAEEISEAVTRLTSPDALVA